MAKCTCKENGDTRGCPRHCNHSHINLWAAEWYCDCGAAWNRHPIIITESIAVSMEHPELSGEVGYIQEGELFFNVEYPTPRPGTGDMMNYKQILSAYNPDHDLPGAGQPPVTWAEYGLAVQVEYLTVTVEATRRELEHLRDELRQLQLQAYPTRRPR